VYTDQDGMDPISEMQGSALGELEEPMSDPMYDVSAQRDHSSSQEGKVEPDVDSSDVASPSQNTHKVDDGIVGNDASEDELAPNCADTEEPIGVRLRYDDRWLAVKDKQHADLMELAATAKRHAQRKVCQPSSDFNLLLDLACTINDWYQSAIGQWARQLGLVHKPAPLKKKERVQEKVDRSYGGDIARVLDFVRSTIIVNTASQAKQVLDFVLEHAVVYAIKNRYDPDYDGEATGGYRDINLQLSFRELEGSDFEGYVFELQIILAAFLEVKSDDGHRKYILCRNMRGD